jgi:putative selenate reductase molybdopterin-binding subunit
MAPDGGSFTLAEVALRSLHQQDQHQIMATASHVSYVSPPPVGAQFAEVMIDTETGQVTIERLLMVVDCGRVINPVTAAGQVEGGLAQALGFAHSEETVFDTEGRIVNARFGPYRIYTASEMPAIDVIFGQTDEPSGPFGASPWPDIDGWCSVRTGQRHSRRHRRVDSRIALHARASVASVAGSQVGLARNR